MINQVLGPYIVTKGAELGADGIKRLESVQMISFECQSLLGKLVQTTKQFSKGKEKKRQLVKVSQ
jgi:hypothetical protein